jgi:dihydroorotate dehydrogenase electron transfer subunit
MPLQTHGLIVRNERIKSLYFLLEIYCPPIATKIKPGQFIMLKVSDTNSPLLRRPFSVYKSYPKHHAVEEKRGRFIILYKKVGLGTRKMTEMGKGQKVDMIGPLGNGFTLPAPSSSDIILIGGGMGIVSLYPLAETLRTKNLLVFIGGKTRDDILCVGDFKKLTPNILIATEDGSLGFKGTVIDLFLSQRKKIKREGRYFIYSCGPLAMLRELGKAIDPTKFFCEVSLETRMACGFGACWGCVVRTNDPKTAYQRVCREGPVFNLGNIVWE